MCISPLSLSIKKAASINGNSQLSDWALLLFLWFGTHIKRDGTTIHDI